VSPETKRILEIAIPVVVIIGVVAFVSRAIPAATASATQSVENSTAGQVGAAVADVAEAPYEFLVWIGDLVGVSYMGDD
jgi:hypothetical protein